jgi:hypothetical protein
MSNAEPLFSLVASGPSVAHVLVGEPVPTSPEHALAKSFLPWPNACAPATGNSAAFLVNCEKNETSC